MVDAFEAAQQGCEVGHAAGLDDSLHVGERFAGAAVSGQQVGQRETCLHVVRVQRHPGFRGRDRLPVPSHELSQPGGMRGDAGVPQPGRLLDILLQRDVVLASAQRELCHQQRVQAVVRERALRGWLGNRDFRLLRYRRGCRRRGRRVLHGAS